jgi:hypothetical protein
MLTENLYEAIEEDLWQHVATAAEKLAQDPRDREGVVLLAQARQFLLGLRAEKSQQIIKADERLARNPHDEEAHELLVQGRECLEDLQIAEAILTGLQD